MIYSYDYDRAYVPAMPVVEIAIGPALAAPLITLRAMVDSGSDVTMIPEQHLRQIQADKCDQSWVRSVTNQRVRVDLYAVSMQFGAFRQSYLEVVANTRTDEIILGRDVGKPLNTCTHSTPKKTSRPTRRKAIEALSPNLEAIVGNGIVMIDSYELYHSSYRGN